MARFLPSGLKCHDGGASRSFNPVTGSSDMLVHLYLTTQCHITDGRYLDSTVY
jgi:hypothetical protein